MFNVSSMLENHGHLVVPFSMKHGRNRPTDYSAYFVENIDYERVSKENLLRRMFSGAKTIYSFEARKKLLKLVSKVKPDIAHVHKISNILTPSILYALREKNVPVVQTVHDYRIVCPNYTMYDPNKFEVCEDCRGHKYFNAVMKKCQKSSYLIGLNVAVESYIYHFLGTYEKTIDLFISPSKFLRKKLVEFGIDKEKIVCMPHFISCARYVPQYSNSNYILYFGRIEKLKGIKTLIKAMEKIKGVKLRVVGEGEHRSELERQVRQKNIRNVVFVGYKPEIELINLIRNSLFTVVPSEWYEPFGFTVLESFALGKPVIGANIGGISDLVENRHNGMLFRSGDVDDLSDKINYLLSNRDLVLEMGKNARRTVEERYDESLYYHKLMDVYENVKSRHSISLRKKKN